MKVKITVVTVMVPFPGLALAAEGNNLGLGIILGEPTGITASI